MKLTTIKDYYQQLYDKFPGVPKQDIRRILNYGWKQLYLCNSYGGDTFIRDRELYKKWSVYLNDEQKKELQYMEILRKADFYRANSKFYEAMSFYIKLFGSRMFDKHLKALKGLILCLLRLSLH